MGFHVVEALLQEKGQHAHTKDIATHIAPGMENEETTRKAISAFKESAAKSFRLANAKLPRDLDDFIESSNNGYYRLCVKGFLE